MQQCHAKLTGTLLHTQGTVTQNIMSKNLTTDQIGIYQTNKSYNMDKDTIRTHVTIEPIRPTVLEQAQFRTPHFKQTQGTHLVIQSYYMSHL